MIHIANSPNMFSRAIKSTRSSFCRYIHINKFYLKDNFQKESIDYDRGLVSLLFFTINHFDGGPLKKKGKKAAYFMSDIYNQTLNRFVVKNKTLHELSNTSLKKEKHSQASLTKSSYYSHVLF